MVHRSFILTELASYLTFLSRDNVSHLVLGVSGGTQSTHSLCKVSHAIDSDAGDGSNREKFGRKDPRL